MRPWCRARPGIEGSVGGRGPTAGRGRPGTRSGRGGRRRPPSGGSHTTGRCSPCRRTPRAARTRSRGSARARSGERGSRSRGRRAARARRGRAGHGRSRSGARRRGTARAASARSREGASSPAHDDGTGGAVRFRRDVSAPRGRCGRHRTARSGAEQAAGFADSRRAQPAWDCTRGRLLTVRYAIRVFSMQETTTIGAPSPLSPEALAALGKRAWPLLPVMPHERRHLLRDEAALLIDELLVKVARGSGAIAVAMGECLDALCTGDGPMRLGVREPG